MRLQFYIKPVLLFLIFLTIMCQACFGSVPRTYTQYGDNAVTNQGQLWAIKLCGVIILRDHGRQDHLAPDPRTYKNQANVRSILSRYWNVNNRSDLLGAIQSLRTDGHAPVFMSMVKIVKEGLSSGKSIQTILSEQRDSLSPTGYNYLTYIAANIKKFEGKDLILWDWGRLISLARWGYEVGYLNEAEAWNIIMPIAEKMRTRYSSWKEYGQLYALTRATWAAGFRQGNHYYTVTLGLVDQLLASGGAWSVSPWPTAPIGKPWINPRAERHYFQN